MANSPAIADSDFKMATNNLPFMLESLRFIIYNLFLQFPSAMGKKIQGDGPDAKVTAGIYLLINNSLKCEHSYCSYSHRSVYKGSSKMGQPS
jgi:hypothetical protein